MEKTLIVFILFATTTLLSTSCSVQFGRSIVVFPCGHKYSSITSGYHVITRRDPVSGADSFYIFADVSLIAYHHPFIVGRITTPSIRLGPPNGELGYFVLNVQNGDKQTGLKEAELSRWLQAVGIDSIHLLSPGEFSSKKNPLVTSGFLTIELSEERKRKTLEWAR